MVYECCGELAGTEKIAILIKRKMPGVGSGCYLVLGNIFDEFGA